MKRGVALSVLLPRVAVIALILFGCVLAFRWGERSRRTALLKLNSMGTDEFSTDTDAVRYERPTDGDEGRPWIEVRPLSFAFACFSLGSRLFHGLHASLYITTLSRTKTAITSSTSARTL